ncbi:hypothetical protein AB838_17590 [Rhodobacteraceae bacterium (ex Bugula neritina AB1)]|nr:hypothetical protein AB838_17590 [Rhodobacteraceae bacterium (ex Bugula neritina AB1)]
MLSNDFDYNTVLPELDVDDIQSVADINGQAPELCILLHHRFGCRIDLISLDRKGRPRTPEASERQAWLARLEQGGVDLETVQTTENAGTGRQYDVILARRHRLGSLLQQMEVLQEIACSAIAGNLTPHGFHRLLRQRHSFPRFQRELANLALDRGHPGLAKRVCAYILRQRDDRFFRRMQERL